MADTKKKKSPLQIFADKLTGVGPYKGDAPPNTTRGATASGELVYIDNKTGKIVKRTGKNITTGKPIKKAKGGMVKKPAKRARYSKGGMAKKKGC